MQIMCSQFRTEILTGKVAFRYLFTFFVHETDHGSTFRAKIPALNNIVIF